MQKWEYNWLVVPRSLGKMKLGGQKGKVQAIDYVNELGNQGWELVGIEQSWPGAGLSDYILFFKRPKP
jgi:hypothetical protein